MPNPLHSLCSWAPRSRRHPKEVLTPPTDYTSSWCSVGCQLCWQRCPFVLGLCLDPISLRWGLASPFSTPKKNKDPPQNPFLTPNFSEIWGKICVRGAKFWPKKGLKFGVCCPDVWGLCLELQSPAGPLRGPQFASVCSGVLWVSVPPPSPALAETLSPFSNPSRILVSQSSPLRDSCSSGSPSATSRSATKTIRPL